MKKYYSKKLIQKKKRELKIKSALFFVIVVTFGNIFFQILKIDYTNIQKINISAGKSINHNLIKTIIESDIQGNFFYFFPKRNTFFYPKENIKKDLLKMFPKIDTLKVNLSFPNTLNVEISERVPYALWCNKKEMESCFFVDDNGYIFSKDNKKSNKPLFFRYYSSLDSPKEIITNSIFKLNKFKEIDSFVRFLKKSNLDPHKLVIEKNGDYELYYGNGSKILFSKEQDAKKVLKNFKLILATNDFKSIHFIKDLDYLDLRFGNKIFYK